MTREEAKAIRIQIQDLLDRCKGCKYVSVSCASIYICPKCPLGQQLQELGKKLDPNLVKHQKKKVMKSRKKKNGWTEEELQFVRENMDKLAYKEIAEVLGRTEAAVKRQVAIMRQSDPNLAKHKKKMIKITMPKNGWTEEELQFVRENKGKLTYKEMSKILGRTVPAIKKQVRMMKEKEMIQELLHA
jgi:hypothetical protein